MNNEKQSLYNVCQALFEAGDSVIVFRPYWVSFPEFVRLAVTETTSTAEYRMISRVCCRREFPGD